jgi:MEMO1 family protein
MSIRSEAVSGTFYSANPNELQVMVDGFLSQAKRESQKAKLLISPHAGLIYSGESAGVAYKQLEGRSEIKRVLLIGPSHHIGFEGFAVSSDSVWRTPLGEIDLDIAPINSFLESKIVNAFVHPQPHEKEHSLEVQLPFLQTVMDGFKLIPIVYGKVSSDDVVKIFEYFSDEETIIVISSDLSHFYDEAEANKLDGYCNKGVKALDLEAMQTCEACGKTGMKGAIKYALKHSLSSTLLSYTTSAKTSGDSSRVVGYASYMFY